MGRLWLVGALLVCTSCAPSPSYTLYDWPLGIVGPDARGGGLVVALGFRNQEGEIAMPAEVGAILLRLSGPASKPLEAWWRNAGPDASVLRVTSLTPGVYAIAAIPYDRSGMELGMGIGEVAIARGEERQVKLLMTYHLGEIKSQVSFEDVLPHGE